MEISKILYDDLKNEILLDLKEIASLRKEEMKTQKSKILKINFENICEAIDEYLHRLPTPGVTLSAKDRVMFYNARYVMKGFSRVLEIRCSNFFTYFENFVKTKEKKVAERLRIAKTLSLIPEERPSAYTLPAAKKHKKNINLQLPLPHDINIMKLDESLHVGDVDHRGSVLIFNEQSAIVEPVTDAEEPILVQLPQCSLNEDMDALTVALAKPDVEPNLSILIHKQSVVQGVLPVVEATFSQQDQTLFPTFHTPHQHPLEDDVRPTQERTMQQTRISLQQSIYISEAEDLSIQRHKRSVVTKGKKNVFRTDILFSQIQMNQRIQKKMGALTRERRHNIVRSVGLADHYEMMDTMDLSIILGHSVPRVKSISSESYEVQDGIDEIEEDLLRSIPDNAQTLRPFAPIEASAVRTRGDITQEHVQIPESAVPRVSRAQRSFIDIRTQLLNESLPTDITAMEAVADQSKPLQRPEDSSTFEIPYFGPEPSLRSKSSDEKPFWLLESPPTKRKRLTNGKEVTGQVLECRESLSNGATTSTSTEFQHTTSIEESLTPPSVKDYRLRVMGLLEELWSNNEGVCKFTDICPKGTTDRRTAAKTFCALIRFSGLKEIEIIQENGTDPENILVKKI